MDKKLTSITQAKKPKKESKNQQTTIKISKYNHKRFNSLVSRNTKQDIVLGYILDCIDNEILITKENILLLGIKNV